MTTAANIMTATAQPATAGPGSTGAAKTGGDDSFSSLLSTLMALTGRQPAAGAPASQSSNHMLVNLLGADFSLEDAGIEGEGLGDLAALLDKLAAALEDAVPMLENGTLPGQAVAGLNAAADALLNLLGPAQANGQLTGALDAGMSPQDLLAKFQTLAEKLAMLPQAGGSNSGGTAQTGTDTSVQNADAAAKSGATDLDALLAKLQKLSEQLELKLAQQPSAQQSAAKSGTGTESHADSAKAAAALLAQHQAASRQTGQSAQTSSAGEAGQQSADDLIKMAAGAQPEVSGQKDKAPQIVNTAAGLAVVQTANDDGDAPRDPLLLAQTSISNTRADLAGAPKMGTAAYQNPAPQINLPGLAFQMMRQYSQGNSRFQIQLDPPEMGRIDIKMDLDGNGGVHARLTVERAETLDLLQRDHRALERALQQAGLDSNKTNLEFSLKQNPFAGQDGQQDNQPGSFAGALYGDAADEDPEPAALASGAWYRGTASPGGINLLA